MAIELRSLHPTDSPRVTRWMVEHWGSEIAVAHGAVYRPAELPGFVAVDSGQWLGLLTYHIDADVCEIITVDSLVPNAGIGTALIDAVLHAARLAGCRRLWLVTTNDNMAALRFYQRRGFVLAALHANAVAHSRQIKPEIPLTGNDGIPIRDEIELEMWL